MTASDGSAFESSGSGSGRADLLKKWALEAGFDRAGVASLQPSEHGDAFLRWLERGDQAQMAYLERRVEIRLDPAQLLEGSRSALCVALHYWPLRKREPPAEAKNADSELADRDLWSRVARYARGDDYHQLMKKRLDQLGARIESAFPGCRSRGYVDTGPLLERELAQRAGIGRIGKNTNLLHREGSWFLVGELLLTIELEPDEPLADLCGDCTLCLEACPTGALPEPYRLDSRRCISYWTIEHRGPLPESARDELADWIFGCDVCQEACPWNSHRHRRSEVDQRGYDHPELAVPERRRALSLVDLVNLDRERYTALFRGSPMKRAKLEGLRRNAVTTLAHSPSTASAQARHALEHAVEDGAAAVRCHAAWALGRMAGQGGRDALVGRLHRESDPFVRSELLAALSGSDPS